MKRGRTSKQSLQFAAAIDRGERPRGAASITTQPVPLPKPPLGAWGHQTYTGGVSLSPANRVSGPRLINYRGSF